jgi:hypothetical protein
MQEDVVVQLTDSGMDEILRTHSINPEFLRADDFERFFQDRKLALLALIEQAMGKQAIQSDEPVAEDIYDTNEENED